VDPAYEQQFYETHSTGSARSAAEVVPVVLEYLQPQSVIDVGCGTGDWLAAFQKCGTTDVFGVDGPWVDEAQLRIPRSRFQRADLTQSLTMGRRFELVISLEVAEHLPPSSASTFVDSLTQLAPVVLFSAAIPYQGGTHHLNERWPTYWASLFSARGFRAIDCLRPRLWSNPAVEFWYAQNMFFLADKSAFAQWSRLREAARQLPDAPLDLVHPRLFLQSTAFAKYPPELFNGTLGAVRDKWLIPARRRAAEERASLAKWPPAE
jgi:SAM-dependent methyltransferase